MKGNILRRIALAGLIAVLYTARGEAAEKVHWIDLQERFQHNNGIVEYRGIDVTTTDGQKHHSRRMVITIEGLKLSDSHGSVESLPRETVARIEIWQRGRFFHHIPDNAALTGIAALGMLGSLDEDGPSPAAVCFGLALTPPLVAYTLASAPVFLAADGITFLLPPKVFEILP